MKKKKKKLMGFAKLKIENPKRFKEICTKGRKKGWLNLQKKYSKETIQEWRMKGRIKCGQIRKRQWEKNKEEHLKLCSKAGKIGGKVTAQKHPEVVKLRGEKLRKYTKSRENRERMSELRKEILRKDSKQRYRLANYVKQHPEHLERMLKKGFVSKPEKQMKEWLQEFAPDFIHGKHLGNVGVPDFHSPTRKKIIEVDGVYWHSLPENAKRDKAKRAYWNKMGYTTFSFSDIEIMKQPIEAQQKLNNILGVHWIR